MLSHIGSTSRLESIIHPLNRHKHTHTHNPPKPREDQQSKAMGKFNFPIEQLCLDGLGKYCFCVAVLRPHRKGIIGSLVHAEAAMQLSRVYFSPPFSHEYQLTRQRRQCNQQWPPLKLMPSNAKCEN